MQALLAHLEAAGFEGAPRALGLDADGREMVSFLPGETVGNTRPWPAWTHSGGALVDVAHWLRRYHAAVADFVPPASSYWREGVVWRPGMIVAHNDAAPYNAVWNREGLVGFVDWDMAGPITPELDVAWVAFSWTPLHAPRVVAAEGFTDLPSRPRRLSHFLREYDWQGSTTDTGRCAWPRTPNGVPSRGGQLRPALVNGAIGTLITRDGRPFSVMAFTVAGDKIVRIDVVRDPDRVHRLASALLNRTERTGR